MIEILAVTVPVFGLAAIGFGAARLGLAEHDGLVGLRFFVLYLALPALIFQMVSEAPSLGTNVPVFAITATFATYCAFAIAFSIAALLNRGNVPELTVEGLLGAQSEVTLMGPAVALAAFGAVAAPPLAVILAVDGAVLAAMTPLMMALGGSGRADASALTAGIARQVFLNPLVIATILGFMAAWLGMRFPGPIDALLTLLRQAAAPAALFLLGAGLPFTPIDRIDPEVPLMLAVKLIVHPLIVYLLLAWVGGFNPIWVDTAVLLAALPPSAEVLTMAHGHGEATDRIANTILFATVVSIATVTVTLILLLNGILPAHPFR